MSAAAPARSARTRPMAEWVAATRGADRPDQARIFAFTAGGAGQVQGAALETGCPFDAAAEPEWCDRWAEGWRTAATRAERPDAPPFRVETSRPRLPPRAERELKTKAWVHDCIAEKRAAEAPAEPEADTGADGKAGAA